MRRRAVMFIATLVQRTRCTGRVCNGVLAIRRIFPLVGRDNKHQIFKLSNPGLPFFKNVQCRHILNRIDFRFKIFHLFCRACV